jgi:hypothetical protein
MGHMPRKRRDVFLCHATEDKKVLVEPLALELEGYGLKVWYDKFEVKLGDSLREKVDEGLVYSRYGVVVLSPAFFEKNWPQKELNGLFAREVEGKKVILPVWHNVSKVDVLRYSPILADMKAVKSVEGVKEIARQIIEVVKPELLRTQETISRAARIAARLQEDIRATDDRLRAEVVFSPTVNADFNEIAATAKPGVIASVIQDGVRVDIFAKDPAAYNRAPFGGKLRLKQEAAKKLELARKTGETVRISPEQLPQFSFDLFSKLFPGLTTAGTLIVSTPASIKLKKIATRVSFVSGSERMDYDFVEFGIDHIGSEEIGLVSRSPLPLKLTLNCHVPQKSADINFELSCFGYEIGAIYKAHTALRLLAEGAQISITELVSGREIFNFTMAETPAVENGALTQFIEAVHIVSVVFGEPIKWSRQEFNEDDYISAQALAEIARKGAVELPLRSVSAILPKSNVEALAEIIKRGAGIKSAGANFTANRIFETELDPGPYVAYIAPSEIVSSTDVGPELVRVEIGTNRPVVFVFSRFSRRSAA